MNTVRVRIPVAVKPNGNYIASRWSIDDEEGAARRVSDATNGPHVVVWIEADVPLPVAVVVEGEVTT